MRETAVSDEAGFTLMEALVALLIIGISAAGIIRATQSHVDSVRSLERRAAAQWVAENALAALAINLPARGEVDRQETMLGERWRTRVEMRPSADPDLRLATVTVFAVADGTPLVRVQGFADAGTITR